MRINNKRLAVLGFIPGGLALARKNSNISGPGIGQPVPGHFFRERIPMTGDFPFALDI